MNIVQIGADFAGSTGRVEEAISKRLDELGYDCYVAFSRGASLNANRKIIRIGSRLDNILHGVRTRLTDQHGFSSRSATARFIEELEKIKPSLVHLHNVHGYYLNIELLFDYLKRSELPVVWTLHDCWPFTGHCTHFMDIHCEKWKSECFKCPQLDAYPKSIFIDNSRENYRRKKSAFMGLSNLAIVTPSAWMKSMVMDSFLGSYPICVINNGVDTRIFQPLNSANGFREKHGLENKFLILGVAYHWTESKGLDAFLKLAELLESDNQVVLVGVSEAQQKFLPKEILGITRTEGASELAQIYSAADILLNPTLNDNLPTVNLEAVACGTPVVTYDTGGCAETIDRTCGIVVPTGNFEKLIDAIALVKRFGKGHYSLSCRARAESKFTQEGMARVYTQLYANLLTNIGQPNIDQPVVLPENY